MKVLRTIGLCATLVSAVALTACGSVDIKPPKPRAITVDGIDIKEDSRGRLTFSRNGEKFKRCDKDCNIFATPSQIDSIKTVSKGLSCSNAVTLVEFRVPVEPPASPSNPTTGSTPDVRVLKRLPIQSAVNAPLNPTLNTLDSANEGGGTMAPMMFSYGGLCLPPNSEGKDGCCKHYLATDSQGHKYIAPMSEDPDCN